MLSAPTKFCADSLFLVHTKDGETRAKLLIMLGSPIRERNIKILFGRGTSLEGKEDIFVIPISYMEFLTCGAVTPAKAFKFGSTRGSDRTIYWFNRNITGKIYLNMHNFYFAS